MGRYLIRSQSGDADKLTGFRKSARAAKVAEGLLPPPIALGGRASAFLSDELDAVMQARAAGADDDAVRSLVRELVAARGTNQAA